MTRIRCQRPPCRGSGTLPSSASSSDPVCTAQTLRCSLLETRPPVGFFWQRVKGSGVFLQFSNLCSSGGRMRELEWGSEGASQTSCWDSNLGVMSSIRHGPFSLCLHQWSVIYISDLIVHCSKNCSCTWRAPAPTWQISKQLLCPS